MAKCTPCCPCNLSGKFRKTPWRLEILSRPKMPRRKRLPSMEQGVSGVRRSALCGFANDRIEYASRPKLRNLISTKLLFEGILSRHRLAIFDDYILRSRATPYNALSSFDPWPPKVVRDATRWQPGQWRAFKRRLSDVLARSKDVPAISDQPACDCSDKPKPGKDQRKVTQSKWNRDPSKISPAALKYVATPNILKLAKPRPTHGPD